MPPLRDFFTVAKFTEELPNIQFLVAAVIAFFIARWIIKDRLFKLLLEKVGVVQVDKAMEMAWYSLYYIAFTSFGLYVYSQEEWTIFPTANFWSNYPHPLTTLMWTYYILELSFYFHGLIAISFERRRKDFLQMIVHHIVTIILISHSYWIRVHRIGMITLIIHNISDVFLYSGKVLHYISKKHKFLNVYVQILFLIFAISFFATRVVFFPLVIIRSCYFEANVVNPECPGCKESTLFLGTLYLLHCYWFYLIIQMAINTFKKPDDIVEDICSEDEEEEEKHHKRDNGKKHNGTKHNGREENGTKHNGKEENGTKHNGKEENGKRDNGKKSEKKAE